MVGLPLEGTRVLDLSRLLPGPYCTLMLADLGADVIKVEDTDAGDYIRWMPPLVGEYSALYHALNRNKRAVSIDLATPSGREIFLSLVERADVVVESFRPGVMERLGLGYESLRDHCPALVLCSITGYGQDGPYRLRAGHDVDYVALAGILKTTGTTDGGPVIPGVQIGDLGGGAQNAIIGILAALLRRQRTGVGAHVDVSMLDGLISWQTLQAARFFADGDAPGPAGHTLNGRHPCYHLYPTSDGWLAVGALEPKFWHDLCEALGLPEFADAGLAEGAEAGRVVAAVSARLRTQSTQRWMEEFGDRDVCVEPVLGIDEVIEHPQVRSRELIVAAGEAGPVEQVLVPLRFDSTRPGVRRPAPAVGEHTAEVLAEIGLSPSAYAALVEEGSVR